MKSNKSVNKQKLNKNGPKDIKKNVSTKAFYCKVRLNIRALCNRALK